MIHHHHLAQYLICGKTRGGPAMYFWLNQWGVNENLGVEGTRGVLNPRQIEPWSYCPFYIDIFFPEYINYCFSASRISLFRIILGDFDYEAFQQTDPIFAPIFYFWDVFFIFFVFFVFFNVFLAIILDAYSHVKMKTVKDSKGMEFSDYLSKVSAPNLLWGILKAWSSLTVSKVSAPNLLWGEY